MNSIMRIFGFALLAALLVSFSANAQEEQGKEKPEPEVFRALPDNYVVSLMLKSKTDRDELSFVVGSEQFYFRSRAKFLDCRGKLRIEENLILVDLTFFLENESSEWGKTLGKVSYKATLRLKEGESITFITSGEASASLSVKKLKS